MAFPLFTAEEVGRDILGGVPAKTVNLYAREGRLPCVWVGKHRRFNETGPRNRRLRTSRPALARSQPVPLREPVKLHADLVAAGRCATLASMSPSLVELLATVAGPRPAPDDLDIITEAGGETDAWVGPEDLDIITKATGETDAFGPEDLDVITRASGECDRWAPQLTIPLRGPVTLTLSRSTTASLTSGECRTASSVILVVTNSADATADWMAPALDRSGRRWKRLDTDQWPADIQLEMSHTGCWLAERDARIDLGDVEAVWWRRPVPPLVHHGDAAIAAWSSREAHAALDAASRGRFNSGSATQRAWCPAARARNARSPPACSYSVGHTRSGCHNNSGRYICSPGRTDRPCALAV